ncbi:hypothetical protein ACQ7RL_000159 [Photobacterium damselae]
MKKGLFVLLVILVSGCSEYTEPQESDIAVFERFLSEVTISSDKNTINVASLYQPQDKLFDAVLAIQRNHWSKAIKELTPYAEKKDPDALFWLAQISYGSNPTENIKAGKMMLESAQLGNPYAALMFSPNNITCQRYFSQYCDKKWVDKAKEIFSNQAKKGDIRAIFYTNKFKGDHNTYINAIINSAKSGYYYPLVDYSNKLLMDNDLDNKEHDLALRLLEYASNNDFIPALESLIKYKEKKENDNDDLYNSLITKGVSIGSAYAWGIDESRFRMSDEHNNYDKYIKAKALYYLSGRDFGLSFIKPIVGKEKKELADQKAQKIIDSMPKVIYIDGTHPMVD